MRWCTEVVSLVTGKSEWVGVHLHCEEMRGSMPAVHPGSDGRMEGFDPCMPEGRYFEESKPPLADE